LSQNNTDSRSQSFGCLIIILVAIIIGGLIGFSYLFFSESPILGFQFEDTPTPLATGAVITLKATPIVERVTSSPELVKITPSSVPYPSSHQVSPSPEIPVASLTPTLTATVPISITSTYTPTALISPTLTISPTSSVGNQEIPVAIGPFNPVELSIEAEEVHRFLFQGLEENPAVFTLNLDDGLSMLLSIEDENAQILLQQFVDSESVTVIFAAPSTGRFYMELQAVESSGTYVLEMRYGN